MTKVTCNLLSYERIMQITIVSKICDWMHLQSVESSLIVQLPSKSKTKINKNYTFNLFSVLAYDPMSYFILTTY